MRVISTLALRGSGSQRTRLPATGIFPIGLGTGDHATAGHDLVGSYRHHQPVQGTP
jgi:hypothetical protein